MKKNEIENIKKAVKEREMMRNKRKHAAVKIQAWFRGVWIRKKVLPPILEVYNERLRQRKIKVIARKIKRRWAPYTILKALRRWMDIKAKEKEEIFNMFKEYSALFIQRCWRGYSVKKKYYSDMKRRTDAKKKIRKLLRKWKLSKILETRRVQITLKGLKDSLKLISEIKNDPAAKLLLNQLITQLPILRSRLKSDLFILYKNGKWVSLPQYKPDVTLSVIEPEVQESFHKSFANRDEIPIRPLGVTYDEVAEFTSDSPEPKKKPINFLKKGGGKMSWKSGLEEKAAEKIEKSFLALTSTENFQEQERDPKSKNFLKRSSKAIKPQKLKWKAERRIDCWLSRDSIQFPNQNEFDLKPAKQDVNIIHLAQLEEIFQEMTSAHQPFVDFLVNSDRVGQKIPVLSPESRFILEFSEEKQQENIEKLENYYNSLCSDELLAAKT